MKARVVGKCVDREVVGVQVPLPPSNQQIMDLRQVMSTLGLSVSGDIAKMISNDGTLWEDAKINIDMAVLDVTLMSRSTPRFAHRFLLFSTQGFNVLSISNLDVVVLYKRRQTILDELKTAYILSPFK